MKDCWNCAYMQLGGLAFPGSCKWFERRGQDLKPIPPEVVDVGCRQHKEKK